MSPWSSVWWTLSRYNCCLMNTMNSLAAVWWMRWTVCFHPTINNHECPILVQKMCPIIPVWRLEWGCMTTRSGVTWSSWLLMFLRSSWDVPVSLTRMSALEHHGLMPLDVLLLQEHSVIHSLLAGLLTPSSSEHSVPQVPLTDVPLLQGCSLVS